MKIRHSRTTGTRGAAKGRRSDASSVAAMRRGSRPSRWLPAVGVMVILAFAAIMVVVITSKHPAHSSVAAGAIPTTPLTSATGTDSPPPWPAPTDVPAAVRSSGLPLLRSEGSVLHLHAHLDVFVDGTSVAVPAGVGIDERGGAISPLHTHDTSGVIHIESPTQSTFTLAQFFSEWNVTLTASQLGNLTATTDSPLRAYVNGHKVTDSPGALTFHGHDEIALVYGKAPA
ncbi:MAG: hypothetical protein ACRDUB_00770, partial [Mycobacterium sp.]